MNPKHEWFKLNKQTTIALFVYYCLLLFTTIFLLVNKLIQNNSIVDLPIFRNSLLISVITSVLGATIFYIRKLYKACINSDIVEPITTNDKLRQIGVFFYFFLRPIFSGVFAIIIIIILKSGISILSTSKTLTIEFYFLSVIVSFFIGFSSGDLIDKFEEEGKKIVTKISELKV